MRNFITLNDLKTEEIYEVLSTAEQYRYNNQKLDETLFAANLFYEPSTRTKVSFEVAQKKLGFNNIDFHTDNSSLLKGESLYDTAKTFEAIGANLLVIRHPSDIWYEDLIGKLNIPVINGGAGKSEHPTQSMLDLLTIYKEFGTFEGVKVAIVGDIKHSRVANSNAQVLKKMGADVCFSAAPGFKRDSLDFPYISIDEAVEQCDVIMLLRIQHERHTELTNTMDYLQHFGLTKERENRMKEHAIIMHPAPINRGVEIDTELVECERSRIFKQMEYGVYVRMAIITELLKNWGIIDEHLTKKYQTIVS